MSEMMWNPKEDRIPDLQISDFSRRICEKYNIQLTDYQSLHRWTVDHISEFWEMIWQENHIIHSKPYTQVVDDETKMPGAKWFSGALLNFGENLLRFRDDQIAIIFKGEDRVERKITYKELYLSVAQAAKAMRELGIQKGDRVAGFLPNIPETIIAMLATTSIGAIWSSSSPDFGINGVLDRFTQIEPKIIFAADGYFYKGKTFDTLEKLKSIVSNLPSVQKVVIIRYVNQGVISNISKTQTWNDFVNNSATTIEFEQVPFDHPVYIMYSSGTTGKPKSIVHSGGGTLLQHLKELRLHTNISRQDTVFYFTTCGWMMWNWLVSSLALGATIVLYDGNPFYPDATALLKMADDYQVTVFGSSAKYISSLESEGVIPNKIYKYDRLRAILSTGSPLSEESFDFVYNFWKQDVVLSSISGGTDIVSCFALGNPALPVHRGELQCVGLGMDVQSLDEVGNPLQNQKGELVCSKAFPSMPVYFWNDPNGEKFQNAYFKPFPGRWCHGDYILINEHGGVKIFGRSDATLNPGGVRIGTAEIYRVVEGISDIADSVVVGQSTGDDERVLLFVKLNPEIVLSDDLKQTIRSMIRKQCSPRHVPEVIYEVKDIPYTINGKKVEIAIKRILNGMDVTNRDALVNPDSLEEYQRIRNNI
ncbi:MAG: acetoacetate--CoA ligase [Candidatus Marinimicrobia bacterium]|nr:acetoacetate--CoA ligase [Candidatus Neomarinimicrobiota bacterium]